MQLSDALKQLRNGRLAICADATNGGPRGLSWASSLCHAAKAVIRLRPLSSRARMKATGEGTAKVIKPDKGPAKVAGRRPPRDWAHGGKNEGEETKGESIDETETITKGWRRTGTMPSRAEHKGTETACQERLSDSAWRAQCAAHRVPSLRSDRVAPAGHCDSRSGREDAGLPTACGLATASRA